jgi:hypothetical protein
MKPVELDAVGLQDTMTFGFFVAFIVEDIFSVLSEFILA